MVHLHEEEYLAVSMIERYRTAISHTLKTVNEVDMSKDPHLSSLLANFARVSDKQRTSVPPWDLALVLKRLTEAPFELISCIRQRSSSLH